MIEILKKIKKDYQLPHEIYASAKSSIKLKYSKKQK